MRTKCAPEPNFIMKGSKARSQSAAMMRLLISQFGKLVLKVCTMISSIPCTSCSLSYTFYAHRSPINASWCDLRVLMSFEYSFSVYSCIWYSTGILLSCYFVLHYRYLSDGVGLIGYDPSNSRPPGILRLASNTSSQEYRQTFFTYIKAIL